MPIKPITLHLAWGDLTPEEKQVLLYTVYPDTALPGLDDSCPLRHFDKHVEAAEKLLNMKVVRETEQPHGKTIYRGENVPLFLALTEKGSRILREELERNPDFTFKVFHGVYAIESEMECRRKYRAKEMFFCVLKREAEKHGYNEEGLYAAAGELVDIFDLRDPFEVKEVICPKK